MNKTANSQLSTTRQQIGNWVHTVLSDVLPSFKIEELGKGVIYCRILNHYFPGIILMNRIIWTPKSEYENILNLKVVQNAMTQLKISIQIDPIRLSKERLNDNWTFICGLFKCLNPNNDESSKMVSKMQEQHAFNYYPQMLPNAPIIFTPKRTIQQMYSQGFYQEMSRSQLFPIDQNIPKSNFYNGSKYSVGKIQGMNMHIGSSSPNKGKWSVNSHMFQNNLTPIIDRIKQILLKSFHNTQKIRQIKILLNIPLNQQVIVKVQQDQHTQIIITKPKSPESQLKNLSKKDDEELIQTREEIKPSGCNQ